ncbi:cytochrome P450 [Lentzea sp. NPDC004782]|uniref:cytochrome P450 n=1 Tax=Lentzea sp. NPDC004782 TaxID=3154458 RepID=UPI0033B4FFFC
MSISELQGSIPETLNKLPTAEFTSCPHKAFAQLRETAAAFPVESSGYRCWVISRYEDTRRVLADPSVEIDRVKHGIPGDSSAAISASNCVVRADALPRIPRGANRSPFYQDGDLHHLVRTTLKNFLSHEKAEELTRKAHETAQSILDTFRPGQQIELMHQYAYPIAIRTACAIAGIPDDERNVLTATLSVESMTSPSRSKMEKMAVQLVDWATELIEVKRNEPGDDAFTMLLSLHDEDKMTKTELTSTYILLVVAIMQVAVTIGNGVFTFLSHPHQLAKALAQPDLFTTCVDEIVRYESNYRFLAPKVATEPLHLNGVTIPAGELVLICLGAANRDPDHFDAPDTFDITRTTTGHLGFGHGRHRCLGEQVGKTETGTALQLFFERFPETTFATPPDEAKWQPGKFQRRLESLPVLLT